MSHSFSQFSQIRDVLSCRDRDTHQFSDAQ
jgi:hypothetical protein